MSQAAKWLLALLFVIQAALPLAAANAQTLAHKGWAGNGLTVEPWWQSAVLYQIDPCHFDGQIDPASFRASTGNGFGSMRGFVLRGIAQRLDYLQSLSVDALVLSPFQLDASPNAAQPFDPACGTAEDFDQFVGEATRHKLRILVDLPLGGSRTSAEVVNAARFWLSRGVAGLRLVPERNSATLTAAQLTDRLRELERLSAAYAGERVVFWEMPESIPSVSVSHRRSNRHRAAAPSPGAAQPAPHLVPQLVADRRLATLGAFTAPNLRRLLASAPAPEHSAPVLYSGASGNPGPSHQTDLACQLATVLLTSPGAVMLLFGQELGIAASAAAEDTDPASLLNWYRRLAALRHSSPALRTGLLTLLIGPNPDPNPDVVAWVRTPPPGGVVASPVLIMMNLADHATTVSLALALRRAGVPIRTGILRTLAATGDPASQPGGVTIGAIPLLPYGVYIGQLKDQPGLESSPASVRRSRRSR